MISRKKGFLSSRTIFTLAIVLALSSLSIPYCYSQELEQECLSTNWPQDLSELKPDPSIRFGRLSNGFRYAIKHNETPRDRVALYLDVQVGSLYEKEDERGYAHYLEHMLFNGSTHFPPGKLVEYFQSIGMNFGADTNAYTTFEETVYTVVLPKGDGEELKKGLLVLSDYAKGASLLPAEVERERGIILAEKLTRDSVEYRTYLATLKNALKGTLLAERQPIGIEKTIQSADSEALRSFYDTWYRPDNMILVVVGDMNVNVVEKLLKKTFNSFLPRSETPPCPEIGELPKRGVHTFYSPEQDAGKTQVSLEWYWHKKTQNDSFELQVENLREYIATSIIQKRLEKKAETKVGLLNSANVYSGDFVNTVGYSGISASSSAERWRDLLQLLENTIRQAKIYGITNQELEIAKSDVLAYFKRQESLDGSRQSTHLAREIVHTINNNRVFQSPQQESTLYASAVSSFTVADIQKSIVNLFDRSDMLVEITGNGNITEENPEEYIVQLYNKAKNQPVQAFASDEKINFPYLFLPEESVHPVQHKEYSDIGVHTFIYGNGTVLHYKKTDFEENQLSLTIQFGTGQRGEPSPGMAMLAESVLSDSGTATLTKTQLAEVLAGSSVYHDFSIEKSRFSIYGKALTEDVVSLFDTVYALVKDPGLREDAYHTTMVRIEQMYTSMMNDVYGSEALHVKPFMAGGNVLFGMAPLEKVKKITLSQLQDWVLPIFTHAQLEISVVGDVEMNEIVEFVGKYFGSLPQGEKNHYKEESVVFPQGEKRKFKIKSELNKAMLAMAWKTQGFTDISLVRRLNMLADVFDERIRVAVREKLGATYSPVVYHTASRFIPDYGMLYVRIITDPGHLQRVEEVVRSISKDLFIGGVSEDELLRVKKPTLTSLKDRIRTNGYWLNTVLSGATLYPEQLQWPTTILEDHEDISGSELSSLAKKYLDPAAAATAIVVPETNKSLNRNKN